MRTESCEFQGLMLILDVELRALYNRWQMRDLCMGAGRPCLCRKAVLYTDDCDVRGGMHR